MTFRMRRFQAVATAAIIGLVTLPIGSAGAAEWKWSRPSQFGKSPASEVLAGQDGWCRYPSPRPAPQPPAPPNQALTQFLAVAEAEPNDDPAHAQAIALGNGPGLDPDIDLTGTISSASDIDVFKITMSKGDILGVACRCAGNLDSVVGVFQSNGTVIFSNDDHSGINGVYPPSAPWPTPVRNTDSALTFVAPSSGDFLVGVAPFNATSIGGYTLQLRLRRSFVERNLATPVHQILFIDFNGATITPFAIFGQGKNSAVAMSPLSSFLSRWGLTAADENAVIDAILAVIHHNFDALRQPGLNGDFPNDAAVGHFDVEIRNSRDDPDLFGNQINISRVIVGGTINETGLQTIGLAEFVDPGNFSMNDTAVCLLDLLSAPVPNPNSVLTLLPASPTQAQLIAAIGKVVGNVASHEAGHFLGCWHTDNSDGIHCLMDSGGNLDNLAGFGPDHLADTADDLNTAFLTDQFAIDESIGTGDESTQVVTAFDLSTGGLPPDAAPPHLIFQDPAAGTSLGGVTTISVAFDEFVAQVTPADLTVNGSPATQVSGNGSGPFQFSGFAPPGIGVAAVSLGAAVITDLSGNIVAVQNWNYQIRDCNGNQTLDSVDIATGASVDCNSNGIPDECEFETLKAQPGGDQTVAPGDHVTLGDSPAAAGGAPPYIFNWTLRGGTADQSFSEANPAFEPDGTGTFVAQLVVFDSGGCRATASAKIVVQNPGDAANGAFGAQCGNLCGAAGPAAILAGVAGHAGMMIRHRRRRKRRL